MDVVEFYGESSDQALRISDPLNAGNLLPTLYRSDFDVPPSTTDQIMFLGYPSYETMNIHPRYGYVMSFNYERNVPKWVCERLTHHQMSSIYLSRHNQPDFKEDPDFKLLTLADYSKTGLKPIYERGHLAAAGNHGYNQSAYNNTFLLSNIAPMFHNVNHTIKKMEDQARRFAKKQSIEQVYITSGTVFDEESLPIYFCEGSRVQVPDAFYKVIIFEERRNQYKAYSYFIKNKPDVECGPLQIYETSVEYINEVAGLKILNGMRTESRNTYTWSAFRGP